MEKSTCELCGELVDYPHPVHPKCVEKLMRDNFRRPYDEVAEREKFVDRVIERGEELP